MDPFLGNMYTKITIGDLTINARYEQTDPAVAQQYITYILPLVEFYQATKAEGLIWTSADAAKAETALENLLNLAKNGLNGNFLSTKMAQNLDFLVRSFESVGVTVTNGSVTFPPNAVSALQQWKDATVLSPLVGELFSTIIAALKTYGAAITSPEGANAATLNRSFQAAVEIDYVQTANELLNQQMSSLQATLGYINNINNTLATLQDLHNRLAVNSKSGMPINYSGAWNAGKLASYKKLASGYFGDPIVPTIAADLVGPLTGGGLFNQIANYSQIPLNPAVTPRNWSYRITNQYVGYVSSADTFITFVELYVPKTLNPSLSSTGLEAFTQLLQTKQSIETQINQLSGVITATEKADPSSLYSQLKNLITDLNNNLYAQGVSNTIPFTLSNYQNGSMGGSVEMFSAFRRWLVDNYDATGAETSKAGKIQSGISKAITAAQAQNTSKQEDVRNFLFLFEEFYKSASSVLQSISQMIQKMAQGIKGA